MMLSNQITKFEFHQYQMRTISPNLMLTKVTLYTVFDKNGLTVFSTCSLQAAAEVKALDSFYSMLQSEPNRAYYGM